MKKCVIIMNPESGKGKRKEQLKTVYDLLRKHDYDARIEFTRRKAHATSIVAELEDDVDLVISAGGDGTLNEVVTGNLLRKKTLPLANLPLGTTNDVGNMYGLHGDMVSNLKKLLEGEIKNIDIVKINDNPFVYVACLGDYIDMAYNTPRELKKKYGKVAYIMYGLKQLRNKIHKYDVKYTVNGETHEGNYSFFFITNSSRVAGMDDLYYDVKLNDNKFEVAFAKVENKADMIKMLVLINTIDIKDIPGVDYYQTDNLEIEFIDPPKVSWCIDGEEYKTTSTKFKFSIDKSINMLMPKENINKLFESDEYEEKKR